MSNKPVAWIYLKKGGLVNFDAVWASKVKSKDPIPLYTNPVKELTDEEKWEIFTKLARSPDLRTDMIRFADSILRKAQE